jgi:alpha-tubulin suppressor-like RCC1 family protein
MLRTALRSVAPIAGLYTAYSFAAANLAVSAPETRVVSFGGNTFGECGIGSESTSVPIPHEIEGLRSKKVISVSSSGSSTSSAALTEDGRVYTFGGGQSGRLGHGKSDSNQLTPRLVEGLPPRIKQVAMGEFHGVALTADGQVWSWGTRATGHDNPGGKGVPAQITKGFPAGLKIEAVFAGREHSIAIDSEGGVWSWGVGASYGLGHGDKKDQPYPKKVSAFEGQKVVMAAAGREHSLFLVEESNGKCAVFAVGTESFGQTGAGGAQPYTKTPQRVSLFSSGSSSANPVAVFAGEYSSFVLTDDHGVYFFGRNKEGGGGLGDTSDVLTPRLLDTAAAGIKGKVVDIAAGGGHTLILAEAGTASAPESILYATGRGRQGQLGRGGDLESSAAYRTTPVAVRHLVEEHGSPFSIAAGRDHSLAVVQRMA